MDRHHFPEELANSRTVVIRIVQNLDVFCFKTYKYQLTATWGSYSTC